MMFHTIRWRIALPYIMLVIILMTVLAIYLNQFLTAYTEQQLETALSGEAALISQAITMLPDPLADSDQLQQVCINYGTALSRRVTVIGADGTVWCDSEADPAQMENHLNRPEIQQALSTGKPGISKRFSNTIITNFLYVAVPIQKNGIIIGFVRLAEPLNMVEQTIQIIPRTIALFTVIALVISIGISILIAQQTTTPLRKLSHAAEQMSMGAFDTIQLPQTYDEIGILNQSFNRLAQQLNQQFAALRGERSKLAGVLANMTDGVIILSDQGMVELINPAAERLFNTTEAQAIGHTAIEVLRHHQLIQLWTRCKETSQHQQTTLELTSEKLFLQGYATPLGKSMPGSILLLIQDLTRLRRLETVRQDFISNVSHELRTPLASLRALTETLVEGALEDPPAARRFLQRMEVEIDNLSQMVQELLELSRIESGKVPLERQLHTPLALLQPAVERMQLQAERAGITLEMSCREDLPAVTADLSRIEQVLMNLLHNAIKFTPPGGKIEAKAYPRGKTIVFEITDTGVGIPPDEVSRIFERFYKADRARSGGGTGLGLSIARHIIEAHGGRIWAESKPREGSSFYFSLPTQ